MPTDALRRAEYVPSFARVTGFPARTIPASVALHVICLSTILLIHQAPTLRDAPVVHAEVQHIITLPPLPKHLPTLDPSPSPGNSPAGSDASSPSSAASSSGSDGGKAMPVVFAGTQHIVSDTPDPSNTIQTILQPDAPQPQKLPAPLPVPSTVKLAAAKLPPAPVAPSLNAAVHMAAPIDPTPAPARPLALPQHADMDTTSLTTNTALVENPRLPQLVSSGQQYEPHPQPAPLPQPAATASATSAPAPTTPSAQAQQATSGPDPRSLLVVNAIEPENASLQNLVPEKEIHGRFQVVADAGIPGSARTSAASPIGSGLGSGTGSGSGTSSGSGSGSSGRGTGPSRTGSAAGGGTGTGSTPGHGNGSSNGTSGRGHGTSGGSGSGSSPGTNNGSGSGTGTGTGTGTLAGSGSGSKPGSGGHGSGSPFGGMSIAGGVDAYGRPNPPLPKPPGPHQAYGMTIIGSGSSGGGLRDFGVFNDGPVYTVYLDVSAIGIRGTRWSLQYGASRDVRLAHPGAILSPPYPSKQVLPHIPSALVASNVGRLLVVQAVLTADGALDAMRVLQSPDERLNASLTECLSHWSFDAASIGTEHVPVKVLLGIPIAASMGTDTTAAAAGQSN